MTKIQKYCAFHPEEKSYRQADYCRRCYDRHRKWRDRGMVNMSTERYYQMLKDQNGTCIFCNREPRKDRFFDTDHDHQTGEVRGLLCNEHNRAVGVIEKNLDLLPSILEYIK